MLSEQRKRPLSAKCSPLFAALLTWIWCLVASAGEASISDSAQLDGEIERKKQADLNEHVPDDSSSELSPNAAFAFPPVPSLTQIGDADSELSPDATFAASALDASSPPSSVMTLKPPQNPPVSAMKPPSQQYFLQPVFEQAGRNEVPDMRHPATGSQDPRLPVVRGARPLARRRNRHANRQLGLISNAASLARSDATEGKTKSGGGADIRSLRPSASAGVPDVVKFGVFVKGFYGANLKNNKFTIDIIYALKWNDTRVATMVPLGVDRLSMSGKAALKKIWMPEVVVTNRDIRKLEVISTTVTIFSTGVVEKVERAGVVINEMFELDQYPFDTQVFNVKIASSKYMLDEVVVEPDEDESKSGAKPELFDRTAYALKSWRIHAFAETDGALKKSRGVLELVCDRKFDNYRENHFTPACLLLMISWGVFWFPFEQPFITPRLALSILALLAFTNLVIKSVDKLPEGAPNNWNDNLNTNIQTMMFCTIVINILSEICKHKMKLDALGAAINNEAKVLIPLTGTIVVLVVMSAGSYGWMSLGVAVILMRVFIIVVLGIYFLLAMARMSAAAAEKQREAEEKKQLDAEANARQQMAEQPRH